MPRHTGSVELLMEEDGTLKVVQRYRLTLPGWPKGFDCHRVVRWLNYTICPLDLKSSSTTKPQSSPDSLFLLYLKAFFLFTLGFCVMMMFAVARYSYAFWGYPYDYTAWLLDPFKWSMVVLLPVFDTQQQQTAAGVDTTRYHQAILMSLSLTSLSLNGFLGWRFMMSLSAAS